ncbi:MAG: FkbM family methyltransferase [Clostridia bacterium]|nr:FkbM family methyltransferase [Clostridia bacterium]
MIRDLLNIREDLWEKLSREKRPLILYGTGDGCEKVLRAMEEKGLRASAVFASDGFARERTFRSFPVLTLSEIRKEYPERVILVTFGTKDPETMDSLRDLSREEELYLPDVPFCPGPLFTREAFLERLPDLERIEQSFADPESKILLEEIIRYRLTGEIRYLDRTASFRDILRLFPEETVRCAFDGGAYTGDTAREMLTVFPHLKRIDCVEPDPVSFRKLSAYAKDEKRVVPHHAMFGSPDLPGVFEALGNRGSAAGRKDGKGRRSEVPVITPDSLALSHFPDLVKLDVEGLELDAVTHGKSLIGPHGSHWIVSVYHRTWDLCEIPVLFLRYAGAYRFYLRRMPCFPAWDLVFLAVKKQERL